MADPLQPGSEFAGHRIEGLAGRGGMGVVYKATHIALDHVVALKVISPALAEDERFRRRFGEESRIAVSIRHPNVVAIHHAGEEQGLLFVTMDLIDGTDLRGLLRTRGPLEPAHAAKVIAEVAAALDAAHARGLVHRDIKPGNVLIEGEGEHERVYLTDFGLARLVEASTGVTATGAFVGTLDYVAPEQIRGERVDARADVYALGCVLFELLTGNAPFAAREDKVAKMYAHLKDEPPSAAVLNPACGPELDAVIRRSMAKQPDDRYPSAGDLARAAEAAAGGAAVTVSERTVAIGAAAPLEGEEAVAAPPSGATAALPADVDEPAEAFEGRPPTRPTTRMPPPAPEATDVAAAKPARARGRPSALALGLGTAALAGVVVGAILIGGGGGDGEQASQQPTVTDGGGGEPGGGDRGGGAKPQAEKFVALQPIAVGQQPVGIAAGEGGVWVANRQDDSVSLIAPGSDASNEVNLEVGHRPEGIAVGQGGVWVADQSSTVTRLDPQSGATEATIQVGAGPRGIATGDGEVWVTNSLSDDVSRIDSIENVVTGTFDVGSEPHGIAIGAGAVWVTNRNGGTVSRLPLNSDAADAPIRVGANPKGIAVAGDSVWVANTDGGTVSRIGVQSLEEDDVIDVGVEPRGVVAAFGYVWVVVGSENEVVQIDPDTGKVVDRLAVGTSPDGITADDEAVWVAVGGDHEVRPIEPR